MLRHLFIVFTLVLVIRLPFIDHAIQGDDVYYLAGAQHAQIDAAHPNHARYVFLGDMVDMRGHPHPPLNAWTLAGLLAYLGDISEVAFHSAYMFFSFLALAAMLSLAGRFCSRPWIATLLFLATPAFVINGNSLESDVPFLAFWMVSVALFVSAVDGGSLFRLALAAMALVLAALAAYQSTLIVPILGLYLWMKRRDWKPAWAVVLVAPLTLLVWQLWERASTGDLPAAVLTGYFQTYGLQTLTSKLNNAAALTAHASWLVFPVLAIASFWKVGKLFWLPLVAAGGAAVIDKHPLFWASFGIGVLILVWCIRTARKTQDQDVRFLTGWVLIFFAGALVLFFAGSARYLLPMAAPVSLLVVRALDRWPLYLSGAFVLQLALSLALGYVNYQHWDGYRHFAAELKRESDQRRVWINGEWGLRYYFEKDGGLPLMRGQELRPGDMIVSSDLAFPIRFTTGGGALIPLAGQEIRAALPLRLVGLGARSAYSSASLGLRPFDLLRAPIDRVRADVVIEKEPELSFLPMNAPEAEQQLVSGIYDLENNQWRWMGERGVLLLKRPAGASPLEVTFYIPEKAPARRISAFVNDNLIVEKTYSGPGTYTMTTEPIAVSFRVARVAITADKTFSVPGDHRRLGIVLSAVGFKR